MFFAAGSASAQTGNDKAAAEALFDQGKAFMAAGNYAAACPKFSESLRLDVGVGTSLWLAECFEKSGKLASAWAQFREAAATAVKMGDPREKIAREHASQLEPRLCKLVVAVPREGAPPGLKIQRDGEEVGAALWGTPVPIDSGDHTITASAPGKRSWTTTAHVPTTVGTQTIAIPGLENDPDAAIVPAVPGQVLMVVPEARVERDTGPVRMERDPGYRLAGVVVGGVGIAGLVVGTVFGFSAMSNLNDANDHHCGMAVGKPNNPDLCDSTGVNERSSASSAATASTIGFALGSAAVVGGALLFVFAPKVAKKTSARAAPLATPHGGGAALTFDW